MVRPISALPFRVLSSWCRESNPLRAAISNGLVTTVSSIRSCVRPSRLWPACVVAWWVEHRKPPHRPCLPRRGLPWRLSRLLRWHPWCNPFRRHRDFLPATFVVLTDSSLPCPMSFSPSPPKIPSRAESLKQPLSMDSSIQNSVTYCQHWLLRVYVPKSNNNNNNDDHIIILLRMPLVD